MQRNHPWPFASLRSPFGLLSAGCLRFASAASSAVTGFRSVARSVNPALGHHESRHRPLSLASREGSRGSRKRGRRSLARRTRCNPWPFPVTTYEGGKLAAFRQVEGLNYAKCGAAAPAELAAASGRPPEGALAAIPTSGTSTTIPSGRTPPFPGPSGSSPNAARGSLLQIHDFAEDGRPDNSRVLVNPVPGNEDPAARLDLALPAGAADSLRLPHQPRPRNPARRGSPGRSASTCCPTRSRPTPHSSRNAPPLRTRPPATRLFLYPTRAIRRKNLGLVSSSGWPPRKRATCSPPPSHPTASLAPHP